MRISLAASGLFDPRQLNAWTTDRRQAIHKAVARGMQSGGCELRDAARGMQSGGRELRDAARAHMRTAFQVKRASFVSSMRVKVLDKKPEQLPALLVGSRIPWLGIHEKGGTVTGNLLIPMLQGRIGPKRFRQVVDALMRSGNAFFIEKDGKVILMAENIRENAAQLTRFKRAERTRTGAKQIKRGQEVPIAVLVKQVDLKRRLELEDTVRRRLPRLAATIQAELNRTTG